MKKLSRIALIALVLLLAVAPLSQALENDQLNGTWSGKIKGYLGSSTVSATCYVTCANGVARFRAAGKTKMLTYTINGNTLILNGSLFGVTKTPEFKYSLNKKKTTLKLTTTYLQALPLSSKLNKASAKVSRISAGSPRVNRSKNVYVYANGVSEYVYLTKPNGTVIGVSGTKEKGRYAIPYDGWKKGYNTLYAYAGICNADGSRPVVKAVGEVLDATDKAFLSKRHRIRVRAR